MSKRSWYQKPASQVLVELGTSKEHGLSQKEAERRLREYGPNELQHESGPSPWQIFVKQFQDFMILVLLGAAAISAFLGEVLDAIAVLAIVVLNAVLGFVQEYRAERSLDALKELTAPTCTVIRDGEMKKVDARDLVPGDLVVLEGGDRVPADIRLVDSSVLQAEEAALTGESVPVDKDDRFVAKGELALGDQRNMVFMGTTVTKGRALGVVVATGMQTEIGLIAELITSSEETGTPLQQRLEQLGHWLVAGCLLIVALVFAAGVFRGFPVYRMFLVGVSLAVAAIPEGLPAVVTIALAIGVQRMAKRNAIIRRLPAVETLGCATVICSDKTGTLTQNQMTVTELVLPGRRFRITGSGYSPEGEFLLGEKRVDVSADPDVKMAARIGAICNHAEFQSVHRNGLAAAAASIKVRLLGRTAQHYELLGDPTEGALLAFAAKAKEPIRKNERTAGVIGELPFDSDRKRMTVVTRTGGRTVAWVKGAPDVILPLCDRIQYQGSVRSITRKDHHEMLVANEDMTKRALRVLALAYRELSASQGRVGDRGLTEAELENHLVFVGLVGMIDPPRSEVKHAIRVAANAGIRSIMVTGDHLNTALAVGRELGLVGERVSGVTGPELDGMDDAELQKVVVKTNVFARVSPKHKLRIVKALKALGEIVAMTGDGVNDAPAVKEADIGISMGRTGTDVTKEASSMVLADDNFATIVAAVEEGRGIYDNIRKFIRYLLGCNVGEVLTMFFGTMLALPLPLLPLQILWMNLVTDGLPAIALGVDPPDKSVMERPPRSPSEGVFARNLHIKILLRGITIGVCTLLAFMTEFYLGSQSVDVARTMAFTTLVMSQLFFVFQCRSEERGIMEIGLFTNPYLVAAVTISFAMQLAVLYVPWLAPIFKTVPLTVHQWVVVLVLSGWSLAVDVVVRLFRAVLRRHVGIIRVRP